VRHTTRWRDADITTRNGYEGSQMGIWAQGEEQNAFSRGTNQVTAHDPHVLINRILPDLSGSGMSTLCYGAVGWPVFDASDPQRCRGILDSGRLNADHTGYRHVHSGVAVGGLSLGSAEEAHWPDTFRDTLRFDPATLDPVFDESSGMTLNTNAAVCDDVLVAWAYNQWPASAFASETYLPGADLNALTGNAFDYKYFCPLGKPHPQQPRQVKT